MGFAAYLFASPVGAQPIRAEAVLVLEAPNEAGWKAGVQALVAELLTTGYELSVRAAHAHSLDQLEQELQRRVAASGATAGVSIARDGGSATAVLCRRGVSPCERLRMKISDAELSRSRLALAVAERLRPLDLPAAPEQLASEQMAAPVRRVPLVEERLVAVHPAPKGARSLRLWLGGGVLLSSGTSAPLAWFSASLGVMVIKPWGLELGLAGSPLPGRAESHAGSLSLRGLEATAFATFEPFSERSFGLSLGLGGGALRLHETASPAPGFDASSHGATVGVVSARARVVHRLGSVYFGLTIDPGMLVPAVTVEAGTEAVLRIGRPWVSMQASVGLEL